MLLMDVIVFINVNVFIAESGSDESGGACCFNGGVGEL